MYSFTWTSIHVFSPRHLVLVHFLQLQYLSIILFTAWVNHFYFLTFVDTSPFSQRCPLYPGRQEQLKPLTRSWHEPPCLQGLVVHSSISGIFRAILRKWPQNMEERLGNTIVQYCCFFFFFCCLISSRNIKIENNFFYFGYPIVILTIKTILLITLFSFVLFPWKHNEFT